jgi:isocitrate dehydrogenase
MPDKQLVTLIPGDGIGPEVVGAARRVVEAAGAPVEWEECEAGGKVFARGLATGVPPETLDSIARTGLVLKGPLETPVGYGEMSANVTLRKFFETYGNIRPVRELPGVITPFSGRKIDLVVVRENVEDLYAGIEYMQTPGVAAGLKLISRKGCEKIVRLAFELARSEGRKSVHCTTKANIMKLTEGFLKRTFEEIAPEYPDIRAEHLIVDNCAHQLVIAPEQFEVIVTTNMNGDILSDLTSGLVGGLGLAASSNIGTDVAMFEAVHGSAPTIAGQGKANPTALIFAAVLLLRRMGLFAEAEQIEHAVLVTLHEGQYRTGDIAGGRPAASTTAFTDAIIANLGRRSDAWDVRQYRPLQLPNVSPAPDMVKAKDRRAVGVDIFVESALDVNTLGPQLEAIAAETPMALKLISNRGTKVYPPTDADTDVVDHWRCRFAPRDGGDVDDAALLDLLARVAARFRWMHVELLQWFDGKPGYTLSQGES